MTTLSQDTLHIQKKKKKEERNRYAIGESVEEKIPFNRQKPRAEPDPV